MWVRSMERCALPIAFNGLTMYHFDLLSYIVGIAVCDIYACRVRYLWRLLRGVNHNAYMEEGCGGWWILARKPSWKPLCNHIYDTNVQNEYADLYHSALDCLPHWQPIPQACLPSILSLFQHSRLYAVSVRHCICLRYFVYAFHFTLGSSIQFGL